MLNPAFQRRLPVGAEVLAQSGAHFRVWAPRRRSVVVILEGGIDPGSNSRGEFPLQAEVNGYFSGSIAAARAGTRYRFRLDDSERLYPDPASRFQRLSGKPMYP